MALTFLNGLQGLVAQAQKSAATGLQGKVVEVIPPPEPPVNMQHVSVVKMLAKSMSGKLPERSHKIVHASDVTKPDFCPRQIRLLDVHQKERPPRYLPLALKATFDVGSATADLMCNKWAVEYVVGPWQCHRCGHVQVEWTSMPNHDCPKCNNRDWRFHEPKFIDTYSKISGSIDMMLNVGHPKLLPVELKIIRGEDFDKIEAPHAEHRIRTQLYLSLIDNSNNPNRARVNLNEARVVYISRSHGKKNADTGMVMPFKEFRVMRDDAAVQPYRELGKKIAIARAEGWVPSEKVCPHVGCTTAKECPVRTECWE